MARLHYNGVKGALSGSHTNSVTTITLAAALTHSGGTNVPTVASPDYIPLSIHDSSGVLSEVVWLTAYTAGATTGTIARGKEGTTGVSHSSGDKVQDAMLVADLRKPLDPIVLNATYGDHFTGSDIDTGKWSRAGSYVNADETAADSWLTVDPGRAAGSYYYQTAPAGDWTLVAKFAAFHDAAAMFGLIAVDNSGNGVGGGLYNNSPNGLMVGNVAAGAYNSSGFQTGFGPYGTTGMSGVPLWIKLVKSGTGWRTASSLNGEVWSPLSASHTNSTTITRIGFGPFFGSGIRAFQLDFFDVQ